MYHRIESVGGYHPAKLAVTDDLLNKVGPEQPEAPGPAQRQVRSRPGGTRSPGVRQGGARACTSTSAALPRVFLVGTAKRVSSDRMVLGELQRGQLQPRDVRPSYRGAARARVGDRGQRGRTRVVRARRDRVRADIRATLSSRLLGGILSTGLEGVRRWRGDDHLPHQLRLPVGLSRARRAYGGDELRPVLPAARPHRQPARARRSGMLLMVCPRTRSETREPQHEDHGRRPDLQRAGRTSSS